MQVDTYRNANLYYITTEHAKKQMPLQARNARMTSSFGYRYNTASAFDAFARARSTQLKHRNAANNQEVAATNETSVLYGPLRRLRHNGLRSAQRCPGADEEKLCHGNLSKGNQ